MNSFDWLTHMGIPTIDKFDIVEIKFKGGRKEYYRNIDRISLTTGDPVVVDVPNGHHIGYVSLQGELVRLQMQKRKIKDDDNILRIYRVATQKDLEKWEEAKNREIPTLYRAKQIIDEMKMDMKLSDVEFQSDNSKATFYYSADDRVDFRELIKSLASEFKIRVEMRQISLRQEAGRLGGIGVCGRELCCSTWIYDFKSVNTSAARYQNLSLNPTKLSGQCGRLKCCLNYELDTYMAALSDIPEVDKPLQTEAGSAKLQKTDIFRKLMWFSYNNDNNWHSITCERVSEILELNSKGVIPYDLKTNHGKEQEDLISKSNMELDALDKKFSKNKKTKKKKKPRNQGENQVMVKDTSAPEARPAGPKPEGRRPNRQSPEKPNQNRQNPPRKNVENRPKPIENQEKAAAIPREINPDQVPKKKKNNKRRFNNRNKGEQNKGDQNSGQ
ncbi:PSP1 domain-containing protein [Aquiflexum gelatinilyticum]|uniref:PSP1 domain-containing protein n=1 Tax=Aquiflexum gelatinilyticum TaxID=2961943 RepID=UPI00216A0E04|nr:regulatory iron-sulfur-containing complex subunit RicT [Aquiflexum gelatinilyticum]MCS4435399.1 Signal peptidase-like protein [Aquiflexum gelatinilyticum]